MLAPPRAHHPDGPPSQREQRARFESQALCHLDALFGTALRLTQNERDAEDLVQDTVLRAYQSFDQFGGEQRCKPWLFKILMNTFINKYRRRVLERQVAESMQRQGTPDLLSDSTLHAARDPEQVLTTSLFSDNVRRALSDLPEEFRAAVLLCDMEEFSYKEIAEIMDCPVGTVMSRLYRGRRLLQEALRPYAQEEGILRSATDSGETGRARGDRRGPGAEVIPLPRGKAGARGRGEGG